VEISQFTKVTAVDCNLCGECVSACKPEALSITKCKWGNYLPAVIAAALFAIALYLGNATELPTIDVKWNDESVVPTEQLETFEMTGMRSVKCFGSSMAFKAKLERIPGVYGVKTFVKHGRVVISYLPSQTDQEKIEGAVFTPTKFRISSPDASVEKVKVITIRTENMHDKLDPNYLGMRIREAGKQYYGLETE
jgi:ferredoxin